MTTAPRSRWPIGVLAIAVLVAAIALIIVSRGRAEPTATAGRPAGAAPDPGLAPEHFPSPTAGSNPAPAGPAPALAAEPAPPADPAASEPGAVRDHRGGDPIGEISRITTMPTGPIAFDQTLSIAAAADAKPIALACAKQIPSEARGAKPVIQVRLQVSIKGNRMTVDDALTDLRDVAGDDLAKSVAACVKQSAAGKTYDAPDHADVAHYQITIPLRVP
jgi:hypothetical protein